MTVRHKIMTASEVADLIGFTERGLRKLRERRRSGVPDAAPPELDDPPATFRRSDVLRWLRRTGYSKRVARFSTAELAVHLGCTARTLRRMVIRGDDLPPHHRHGGKIYFLAVDVSRWARGKNKALKEWADALVSA